MKRALQVGTLVVATIPILGGSTLSFPQDEAAIENAIRAGQNKKAGNLLSECWASPGFGEGFSSGMAGGIQPIGKFTVYVGTHLGRIALLAQDAKKKYTDFTTADVPEDLLTPAVYVTVIPDAPKQTSTSYDVPSPIEHIVLKSKAKPDVVAQPANLALTPVSWGNLLGGKVEGNSGVAVFSLDAVRRLPSGDFDVVVITAAGERKCKVGSNDRKKLGF